MKKYLLIATVAASGFLAGCGAGKGPGYAYMPDMFYSVANETYADNSALKQAGVSYNGLPVAGTISRNDDLNFIYPYKHDSLGYALSATVKNPLDTMGVAVDMKEAERIYQIHCGVCHGAKLDGNGPLFKGGEGPYSAAPRNFLEPAMVAMADGTMFHSITYGIRAMGPYASQVTPKQRWEIISFIRSKQKGSAPAEAPADSTAATKEAAGNETAAAN